jgi:hypothetical protein
MKKIIFLLLMSLVAKYSFGQITNIKDTIFATMSINSSLTIKDTMFNFGTTDIPVQWNVCNSSTIAPGHSGVSICSFPGACYNFDTTVHTVTVNQSSALTFFLSWDVDATAAPGSISYVKVNTDIGGGKDIVWKITVNGAVGGTLTSLSKNELDVEIKMYPIPTTDFLNVEMPDIKASKIEIINMCGLVVNTTATYGNPKTEISLNNLNPGLYIVNIYNAENIIVARRKITKH